MIHDLRCPRCNGNPWREHDCYGDTIVCVCGWRQDCAPDGGPLPELARLRYPSRVEARDREGARQARSASMRAAWERRWAEGRR